MKKLIFSCFFLFFFLNVFSQQPISVGTGSYAEYTPLYKSRTEEHAGDQSRLMETRTLYMTDKNQGKPIPTNDWWTDLIVAQYSGNLWAYPQVVNAEEYGFFVAYPKNWTADGREMTWNSQLEVLAKSFHPVSAAANNWHDWGLDFQMKDNEKEMNVTLAHGVPFTWVETKNLTLQLRCNNADFYTSSSQINLPYVGSQLVIQIGDDAYGIYAPEGTTFAFKNELVEISFSGDQQFLSIAVLPSKDDLNFYAQYAYVIPRQTEVTWDYNETAATVNTNWNLTTENLIGGTQKQMLQGFIPHHYKNSSLDFSFTPYEYATPRGKMKMAAGQSFNISYKFNGMLPYYAAPQEDLSLQNPYQKERMKQMIAEYADKGGFGADTYWGGKGLTQMALYMTFAHQMGEMELFEKCKNRLKSVLVNWFTYTPGEKSFFFARYNRWGALVGYDTSYDSDTFNDHHFHYGYYTYASSLLAMFDEDFKKQYGEMATLVAKDYANWDKSDTDFPFFRTLDPWAGHSYAGGLAGWGGNGQESSSEAMQSWGGLYLLGVATDNQEMRDAGIFGWTLEARAIAEYWFDRDRENIDYTKYDKPYNSNLTSQGIGWWTWFSGDPVWMHSIQWMPISPCLKYLYEDVSFAEWEYTQMWNYKEVGGWSTNPNVESSLSKESGLGNVVLSFLQIFNPDSAAALFDSMWDAQMPIAKNPDTGGISYFITHSHRTYGDICWDIHANIPTATTYKNPTTEKYTYIVYNPKNTEELVSFYQNETIIKQVKVPANQLIAFSDEPVLTDIEILQPLSTVVEPNQTLQLNALLKDQYGATMTGLVNWSVNQGGTISSSGFFSAGATKTTTIVTAQSAGISTSIQLKIDDKPILHSAEIFPQQDYLEIGKTLVYDLKMLDQYGEPYLEKVNWQIIKNGILVKSDSILNLNQIGIYTVKASVGENEYSTEVYVAPKFSNIALHKTAIASSFENAGTVSVNATDGDTFSRWGSAHSDPQWIYVDLSAQAYISYVSIVWEAAYSSLYEIQISNDAENWTTIETENGLGGTQLTEVNEHARYVRMLGLQRASAYGHSLYEFEVYGVMPQGEQPSLFGIDIQPQNVIIKEGESINYIVTAYDQYGNTLDVTPTFTVLSGDATIQANGLFTANKYGAGVVQAQVGAQIAKANFLIEETIKLHSISISPKVVSLVKGKSQAFSYLAKDQFGANLDMPLSYNLVGEGAVLNRNLLTANQIGEYLVIVGNDTLKDTAIVNVTELSQTNLAFLKPVYATSYENEATLPSYVNDGDLQTRWGSAFYDPQSIVIDLKDSYILNNIKLYWEVSYSSNYKIEVSVDEENWTTIHTDANANGGVDDIQISSAAARFVKITSLQRNTVYGASLLEVEVFGTDFYENPQPTSLSITPSPLIAYLGENLQLTPQIFDQYELPFTPTSEFNWSVNGGATINQQGVLTPNQEGNFILTLQYENLSQQFPIQILDSKVLSKIEIVPTYAIVKTNENLPLSLLAYDQYGNTISVSLVQWSVTGTASITSEGVFFSTQIGAFQVTATVEGISSAAQINVIQENNDNIALNKPTTTSSGTSAAAVDGNDGTRWESAFQDGPEWIVVDLNDAYILTDAQIVWEAASAANYEIQVSKDGNEWTTIQSVTGLQGARTDSWRVSGVGRYVRVWCTKRSTGYGYSIWEFRLYGSLLPAGEPYNISLENPKNNLLVGENVQYHAVVKDKNNDIINNPTLNWTVSGVGTVDNNGFFSSIFEGNSILSVSSGLASASINLNISTTTDIDNKVSSDETIYLWTINQILYVQAADVKNITIFDIQGRLLFNQSYSDIHYIEIPISNKGVYIVKIQTKEKNILKKIAF